MQKAVQPSTALQVRASHILTNRRRRHLCPSSCLRHTHNCEQEGKAARNQLRKQLRETQKKARASDEHAANAHSATAELRQANDQVTELQEQVDALKAALEASQEDLRVRSVVVSW